MILPFPDRRRDLLLAEGVGSHLLEMVPARRAEADLLGE